MSKAKYIIFLGVWLITIQELLSQPFYKVAPVPFNTSYADEMAAVPYDNGLIYCSNRRVNVLVNRTDLDNNPLYHLYYILKKDSVKWGTPRVLYKELATNAHQGPCSIGADGKELYYTMNNETGEKIFVAHKDGAKWSNIRPFAYNNPNYKVTHPSLSKDGKWLFFASDMPGGYGGFDIYCCEWTPRGWGTPKNLGAEVNSTTDELYPFIQGNGVLYFSSYGHGSMGGLDIFSVREVNGAWAFRQQLEPPINSGNDDFAYAAVDADGTEGYFSSNRNSNNINIFSFESLFPVFTACNRQEENDYTYEFFDVNSEGINLDTVTFRYEWNLGDGTIKRGKTVDHTFASTGQYLVELSVIDTLTGEFQQQVASYPFDVLDIEQPYITANDTVEVGKPVAFNASKTYLPELDIEGYYWIFSDGIRTKGEYIEHVFVSPGIYQVQLGIIGKSKDTGEQAKVCSFREITVR